MITTICVLLLVTINMVFGLLAMLGKIRVVIVHSQPESEVAVVSATEEVPRKRGRPRKDGTKTVKTNHLHLPHHIDADSVAGLSEFFRHHKSKGGERVVLHYMTDGIERSAEVPFLVGWNEDVKLKLNTVLGGWA